MQVSARDFCASRAWLQRQLQFATKTHWQHFNECCSRRRAASQRHPPSLALATPYSKDKQCNWPTSRGWQAGRLAGWQPELGKTLGKHWSREHRSKHKACGKEWLWDWVVCAPWRGTASRQPGNQTRAQTYLLWHRHFCMRRMVAFFGLTVGCDAGPEQETTML